jgi:hypothetical protein
LVDLGLSLDLELLADRAHRRGDGEVERHALAGVDAVGPDRQFDRGSDPPGRA